MNRAERLYHIHGLLKQGRAVSLRRFMDELEMSMASIKRDFRYLRAFMGAPIVYDHTANGYRYNPSAPEFELPGLWFNDTELYALLASEQLLEAVQPGLLGPYIGPLKGRIRKLLEETGHRADMVSARIRLQPFAPRRVDNAIFGRASAAVLNGQVATITYHGREHEARTERSVHAYRLLHYRDNWYLVGWCEQAGALRTFSLDRIERFTSSASPVMPPDDAALDRYLGASFGIFTGEASAWAVLRFNPERARWVADEVWHPDQIGQWVGETYELQVPYSDPRELLMDILKYGPDVEVVAPAELRHLVAGRVQEAAQRYHSDANDPIG